MTQKKTQSNEVAEMLSVLPPPVGRLTVPGARFAILITITAWLVYLIEQGILLAEITITPRVLSETLVYFVTVTMLTISCLAYLIARLGNFERVKIHRRVPRSTIDESLEGKHPSLTVLVPSYREDERTIRYTLLSAALQEYPNLNIVLLIDDPPNSSNATHQLLLDQSRRLPKQLEVMLNAPYLKFKDALEIFERRTAKDIDTSPEELILLASYYSDACEWFITERAALERNDHIDDFFEVNLLGRLEEDLRGTASALRSAAEDPDAYLTKRRVRHLYTRLVNIFQAEFSTFERKRFASLSHEPNKAMNLNSYIGLMGGSYSEIPSPEGPVLVPHAGEAPDLEIPDSQYVLTLDADSILLPEYCLRLVYFMEQEENSRTAVAQTPYTSFRGAASQIERIASATTDIQHVVHQGLEKHNAAFWVGANAVIRKSALMELEQREEEDGLVIPRFINDRTVIEDTESSLGLRALGWRIYNYPERMSYSATPPDFGSLVIQRQRWANGGLIILPELLKVLRFKGDDTKPERFLEMLLRITYLASIGWTSVCLCILFFYPFQDGMLSSAAVLTAAPYFLMMMFDLKRMGYRKRDIFHIYGLNLLLLPINLAGTIQSLVQIVGGHKLAFARTPKVQDRTPGPLIFLLIPLILMIWSLWTVRNDVVKEDFVHLSLTLITMSMLISACITFIGAKTFVIDLVFNVLNYVYVPTRSQDKTETTERQDWASVLYVGTPESSAPEKRAELAFTQATKDYLANQNKIARQTQ
jgi:cellulose synthase/poly-beta-1,6-N-acetylglucosamine synthase-like glycosyltransferase